MERNYDNMRDILSQTMENVSLSSTVTQLDLQRKIMNTKERKKSNKVCANITINVNLQVHQSQHLKSQLLKTEAEV